MQGFHEDAADGLEEFDWFLEGTEDSKLAVDYDSLIDLKEEALGIAALEPEAAPEFACGDILEDGLMWKHSESLTAAIGDVFSAVSEKLCGCGIPEAYGHISRYLERLGERCELVWSGIYCGTDAKTNWLHTETIARIEACLSEQGCVIAMVGDEQWRGLVGEEELPFADSGVRTMQVIGMQGKDLVVNDFANEAGCRLRIPMEDFCGLHGILAEVYK